MRITFEGLLTMAQSPDDKERKRAFVYYNAWVKQANDIDPDQRLTMPQRYVLQQIFKQKGFKVERK